MSINTDRSCTLFSTQVTYNVLTCPPLAIMFTHSVLVGLDECSKHDRISVLNAYFESFCLNTYTEKGRES